METVAEDILVKQWSERGADLFARGEYEKASEAFEESIRVAAGVFEDQDPRLALLRCGLGHARHALQDFAGAALLFDEALELMEMTCGPTHENTIACLVSLFRSLERVSAGARPDRILERLVAMLHRPEASASPALIQMMGQLAAVCHVGGRLDEARKLLELQIRALEMLDQATVAADLVLALNQLGCLHLDDARPQEAVVPLRRAQELCEKAFGAYSPLIVDILTNLAAASDARGNPGEAQDLYWHALSLRKILSGPRHPGVAAILNNLGELTARVGPAEESEWFFQEALGILESGWTGHEATRAAILCNLGRLRLSQGRHREAISDLDAAVAYAELGFGPLHPDLAAYLQELAAAEFASGEPKRAEGHLWRAYEILEQLSSQAASKDE